MVLSRIASTGPHFLAVIASGAKQSRGLGRRPLDCFAALAMTAICATLNEAQLRIWGNWIRPQARRRDGLHEPGDIRPFSRDTIEANGADAWHGRADRI